MRIIGETMKIIWIILLLTMIGLGFYAGYSPLIYFQNDWMDSPETADVSLSDPTYLVSNNHISDKNKPVFIAIHGYSASTAPWLSFKEYVKQHSDAEVSMVLLGAHGRNIYAFRDSTWQEWREPILQEITALKQLGHTNINIIAASAACPLVLTLIYEKLLIEGDINNIIFIDPFIISANPMFKHVGKWWANLVQNQSGYQKNTTLERQHWYNNNPMGAIKELKKLNDYTRLILDQTLQLPKDFDLYIFQSNGDPVSDPKGASYLLSQLKPFQELNIIDSKHHVFTREFGRSQWNQSDADSQEWAFKRFIDIVSDDAHTDN